MPAIQIGALGEEAGRGADDPGGGELAFRDDATQRLLGAAGFTLGARGCRTGTDAPAAERWIALVAPVASPMVELLVIVVAAARIA